MLSKKDKNSILKKYIKTISEIGELNNYSLEWLCHPISEKNNLSQDNLFNQIINYVSSHNGNPKKVDKYSNTLHNKIHNDYNFLLKKWGDIKKAKKIKEIPAAKNYTIVRTWFDHRSVGNFKSGKDTFFGKLPTYLKSHGHNICFFGEILNDYNKTLNELQKSEFPIITNNQLLTFSDLLSAFMFKLTLAKKIKLPKRIIINKIDFRPMFVNYIHKMADTPIIFNNYLYYIGAQKLFEKKNVSYLYYVFENQNWEKVTKKAVRETDSKVPIIGFQHAQMGQDSTRFMLGSPSEAKATILDSKIVTVGKVTHDFLIKHGFPSKKIVPGCALRQQTHKKRIPLKRSRSNTILVPLWTFERSVEMIEFLKESGVFKSKFKVILATHPNYPLKDLLPQLSYDPRKNCKIANTPLDKNFKNTFCVVYSGTTASIDALLRGLPVVNVEFESDALSPDPLYSLKSLKWNVTNPTDLIETLDKIKNMPSNKYYEEQKKALKFANSYLSPVTEKRLQTLLPDQKLKH